MHPDTALLIGREQLDFPRFKDSKLKDNRHARSFVYKDRFAAKTEEGRQPIGQLKVSGR